MNANEFLQGALKNGWVEQEAIRIAARQARITRGQLKEAREILGVVSWSITKSTKEQTESRYYWALPDSDFPEVEHA